MLRQFIPGRLEDNPSMTEDDPDYEAKLYGLGSATLVAAMRYGDWDVVDQRRIFRLCAGSAVGVHLNEACMMTPGKSISLLVGAGTAARVDHYFSQCARCWMRDCAYRRAPVAGSVRRG